MLAASARGSPLHGTFAFPRPPWISVVYQYATTLPLTSQRCLRPELPLTALLRIPYSTIIWTSPSSTAQEQILNNGERSLWCAPRFQSVQDILTKLHPLILAPYFVRLCAM